MCMKPSKKIPYHILGGKNRKERPYRFTYKGYMAERAKCYAVCE